MMLTKLVINIRGDEKGEVSRHTADVLVSQTEEVNCLENTFSTVVYYGSIKLIFSV